MKIDRIKQPDIINYEDDNMILYYDNDCIAVKFHKGGTFRFVLTLTEAKMLIKVLPDFIKELE